MAVAVSDFGVVDGDTLFLGGEWSGSGSAFVRHDPAALDRETGKFSRAGSEHVAAAYEAAVRSARDWGERTADERAAVLRAAADILNRDVNAAAHRLVADIGKPLADSRAEVVRSAAILRYFAGELSQPSGSTYPSADPQTLLMTIEQPLGPVCAITPWNFPFAIPTWKIAPALGFGNAVVWKPAEAASGSAVFLTRVLEAAGLPAGALNLLTGHGRELSVALTSNPALRAITFTGSGPVGAELRSAVADRTVKAQLELGGKNPAIVLADADLDVAAREVAHGAMLSAGQRCTATSRVYVETAVADDFTRQLEAEVLSMKVGDPTDPETVIGPLASEDQRDTVRGYVDLARSEGATFVTGADQPEDNGCFVHPVVLRDVSPDSALIREEIFGPVLVVQEVSGWEEAIELANETEFGLSSAIFTRNLTRAIEFVRRSESGLVHVNRETAGVEPHVPFGGLKASGSQDREQGKAARQFFTSTKTVYMKTV